MTAAVFALTTAAVVVVPATTMTRGAAAGAVPCPAPRGDVVRSAPGAGKTVALTFDDGPSTFTPQILRILRAYDVRATFFQTGAHVSARPGLAAQVAAEGHLIADHTYDHRYPREVSGGWTWAYLTDQFTRTNRLIRSVAGQQPCFFRPPGGYQTTGMVRAAASRGMSTVMWSVDTEDWKQPGQTSAAFTARIVARATAGSNQSHPVLLMHDGKASHEPEWQVSANRSNDVKALPAILSYYKSRGYRFVDLLGRSGLPPGPTRLSLTSPNHSVAAGTTTTVVAGHLAAITGGVRGVPVRWYSRRPGAATWKSRGTVWTNRYGNIRVLARPTVQTQYTLRFWGTDHFRRAGTPGSRTVSPY